MGRRRRGELDYALTRFVDIVWSVLIVFVILLLAFTLWKALFGTNKQALNQYHLMADMTEGMLASPLGTTRRFTLSADLTDRESFHGTILARSSDGTYTTPVPPTIWYPDVNADAYVNAEKLNAYLRANPDAGKLASKKCGGQACLCFSKVVLDSVDTIPKALNGIVECRSYPGSVLFDFESIQPSGTVGGLLGRKQEFYIEGQYPVLTLRRGNCPTGLATAHPGIAQPAACLYAAVTPISQAPAQATTNQGAGGASGGGGASSSY